MCRRHLSQDLNRTRTGATTARQAGLVASEAVSHMLGSADPALHESAPQTLHQVLSGIDGHSPAHRTGPTKWLSRSG